MPVTPETNLRHDPPNFDDNGSPRWNGLFFTRPLRPRPRKKGSYRLSRSLVLLCLIPCAAQGAEPICYRVDLTARESHLVQVTMNIPGASADTEIQLPAWNCLYQIRDFVKNVEDMRGECDGEAADLDREDLNTWRGPNRSCRNLSFHYSVYADTDGPFDSILDGNHSFLNLAMVLFYLPQERDRAMQVKYSDSRRMETRDPPGRRRR